MSAKIGRVPLEDAVKDILNDYSVNGKKSHDNLKTTVIEGALEPWFRGRRMATITTADIRAFAPTSPIARRRATRTARSTGNSPP